MATKMAMITCEQAQKLARLGRQDGCKQLAEYIGWSDLDEDDNPQQSIELDYYYDNIMFCVQKGFPWPHVTALFTLSVDLLHETKGTTLGQAAKIYQEKCIQCTRTVSEQNIKIFTEFFFTTFMKHFQLYQYVLSHEQERVTVKTDLLVCPPPEPMSFKDSKVVSIWEYEQKIKAIENEEEGRKIERSLQQRREAEEDGSCLENTMENVNSQLPAERETLEQLIHDVASAHITAASHAITHNLQATMEDLDFKLQKTSLPRPSELGPPPRFRNKTPLSGKSGMRVKDSKSRSSSRSSKKKGNSNK